jgi:hypothetical protein
MTGSGLACAHLFFNEQDIIERQVAVALPDAAKIARDGLQVHACYAGYMCTCVRIHVYMYTCVHMYMYACHY